MPQRSKLITAGCLAIMVIVTAALLLGYRGDWAFLEGCTNGAFSAFWLEFALWPVGLLSLAACFAFAVFRIVRGDRTERFACVVILALCVLPWPLTARRTREQAFLQGLTVWAEQLKPAQMQAWGATVATPAATAAVPPEWWLVRDWNRPFELVAPPGGTRPFFTGPLPDDVRIIPATSTIVLSWRFSGSRPRFVIVTAPGNTPPGEFDASRVWWSPVGSEIWLGLQEMH